jgi:hypothetical protein
MNVKDWTRKLGALFRPKAQPQSEDATPLAQAQSAWEHFAMRQILPAFQEIKSTFERNDGTAVTIQQATMGEHWVRLTWSVAPSPSLIASLPPSVRRPGSPRIVLTYGITADVPSGDTRAWSETRIPNPTGSAPESMRIFREELGDYRRKDLTKDAIRANFLANYQRHVLGARR